MHNYTSLHTVFCDNGVRGCGQQHMVLEKVLIQLYHQIERADGAVLIHCPRHVAEALSQDRPRVTHAGYLIDLCAKKDFAGIWQEIRGVYTCARIPLHDRQVVVYVFHD